MHQPPTDEFNDIMCHNSTVRRYAFTPHLFTPHLATIVFAQFNTYYKWLTVTLMYGRRRDDKTSVRRLPVAHMRSFDMRKNSSKPSAGRLLVFGSGNLHMLSRCVMTNYMSGTCSR